MLLVIKPITIIFLGAIVTIIGGLITAYGTLKHNRASSEKSTNTLNTVTQTNRHVESVMQQNKELTDTVDKLRKENSELHTKLANYLTGGDSYCKMDFAFNGDKTVGTAVFLIKGEYPLKDISARIVDLSVWKNMKVTEETLRKDVVNVGNLQPGLAQASQKRIPLDKKNGTNINVFFQANSGLTIQKTRMRFVNDKWVFAIQISERKEKGKILYESISPEFPNQNRETVFN